MKTTGLSIAEESVEKEAETTVNWWKQTSTLACLRVNGSQREQDQTF